MARKRKDTDRQPDMPATSPADTRHGSRHRPRKMMALPPWLYDKLREDARKNHRPAAWHLRHLLITSLIESGTLTQEEADRLSAEE